MSRILLHPGEEHGMTKLLSYDTYDNAGPHIFPIRFGEPNRHIKMATEVPPLIAKYIAEAKPIPGKSQLLIDAMGAGEWWGSNKNGDIFYEDQLGHPGPDYGFETFMHYAYPFKHHCFPAGTLVTLADRTRVPIENISTGDVVVTSAGNQAVDTVFKRHYEGMGVSLVLRGRMEPLIATENHRVLIYTRDQIHCRHKYSKLTVSDSPRAHIKECREVRESIGDPTWVPISQVLPGDYLASPLPQLGNKKESHDFCELAGWVASEGYINKDNFIQFTFSENNTEDIESVTNCLGNNGFTVNLTPRPQYGLVALNSNSSPELCNKLRKYVTGILSEKTITNNVLDWDEESILVMLGAYIDGDGCVISQGRNKGSLVIRSSSPQMLYMLQDIIVALGCNCATNIDCPPGFMISPTNHKKYATSGSGCVTVGRSYAPLLTEYSRKHKIVSQQKSRLHKTINNHRLIQITEKKDIFLNENVYNLEIQNKHEYVVSDVLVHNCNKDPRQAYGDKVVLSVYNPAMHRVNLVVAVHNDKAADIIRRVDNGDFSPVSMGCRVPYDQCSICGNKAKKRPEYCDHLKWQMNRTLPGGKKVMAINWHPKFFDISFVLVGAEKASHVLMKIAQQSQTSLPLSADLGRRYYILSGKTASVDKKGTIDKRIPSKIVDAKQIDTDLIQKCAPVAKQMEPKLSDSTIQGLSKAPLREVLSTLAFLGIDLKPEEFQKIILIKTGHQKEAERLDRQGLVFDEYADCTIPNGVEKMMQIDPEHVNQKIAYDLSEYIPHRSCFAEFLTTRLDKMASDENPWYGNTKPTTITSALPVVGMIGLYQYLKNKTPEKAMTGFSRAISRHPWLLGLLLAAGTGAAVAGVNLLQPQPLLKQGSIDYFDINGYNDQQKTAGSKILLPLGLGAAAYMYSGVQRHRALRGHRLNKVDNLIARRPEWAAIAGLLAGPKVISMGSRALKKLSSSYGDIALFSLVSGARNLPAAVLGGLADAAVIDKLSNIFAKRGKQNGNKLR